MNLDSVISSSTSSELCPPNFLTSQYQTIGCHSNSYSEDQGRLDCSEGGQYRRILAVYSLSPEHKIHCARAEMEADLSQWLTGHWLRTHR
jgi:hypothetical protein